MTINFPHKSMQNFPIFSHSLTHSRYVQSRNFSSLGEKVLVYIEYIFFFHHNSKKNSLGVKGNNNARSLKYI